MFAWIIQLKSSLVQNISNSRSEAFQILKLNDMLTKLTKKKNFKASLGFSTSLTKQSNVKVFWPTATTDISCSLLYIQSALHRLFNSFELYCKNSVKKLNMTQT